MASTNGEDHVVVVGVDGSEISKAALRWAARQCELTGASLVVVMTWRVPMAAYHGPIPLSTDEIRPPDIDSLEMTNRTLLEELIVDTLGEGSVVPVSTVVLEGHAGAELVLAAKNAELLVVGSRGRGALTEMLLGSVSEHCVLHSSCPVVVVRHHDDSA
jgi:nucleotide-binding universal stress UspA family protein